jgi:hypothetical protein
VTPIVILTPRDWQDLPAGEVNAPLLRRRAQPPR